MIGLCSLALLALQSTAGLPPGTGVDALLRFDATGDYLPNGQSLVTAGDDTYVLTSGTSFSPASGMRNWTRTRLDAAGSVVWSHTDYQVALGTSNVFTGDLVQAPLVAPTPGLLLSAQVDARDQGTYRLLAHSLVDGGEVWTFEPDVGPNGLEITANVQSFLLLDDPNGVVFQVLVLGGDLVVRRLDAFSGTLISVSTYLTEFDGSGVFDAALSADRQQLYLSGFVSINNLFETKSSGIALAIDTNTGAELWRTVDGERLIYELEEQPGTSELALLAAGDLGDRRLWAVDGPSGTEAWSQLLTAPVIGPSEMRYSPDGSRLVVASRQPFQPFPINEWTPGGVLEAYDAAAGAFLWERDVSGAPGFLTTLALEPQQLAVHPDGTVLWSYTWTTTLPFYENETVVLEGAQVAAGTPNFAFLQSDTVDPLSEGVRDPLVRRIVASSGADDFLYEPEDSGPVVSFAVNFEATDDATRAAMMRYVEGVEPRLELVWLDLATGAELWSDVLPATDGLNIADDFQDRNREMLLSPDESVLISVVRGDGGKAYKLRLRAYEVATGQLLWTDEFDKQKGVSLFSDGLTRPGNRSVEVTDQEVILAGNIT
ncbi:MAG: outer membrane protein assembly factor BamB family protein, partial [Planctomycetota bacterium]